MKGEIGATTRLVNPLIVFPRVAFNIHMNRGDRLVCRFRETIKCHGRADRWGACQWETGHRKESTPVPSGSPRVAVVEDFGPLRALLIRDLSGNGFRVDGFADAASLWRHFPQRGFDLVVLNIGLPDEDGFSVSRRLRRHFDIPVVILSGYGSQEHQLLGLREGADAYLVKPVDTRILVATMQKLVRRLRVASTDASNHQGWRLVDDAWVLRGPGGPDIALNAHERALLRGLAAADDQWVSTEMLLPALARRAGSHVGHHELAHTVWRLHRKIAACTFTVLPLEEARGAYRFRTLIDDHAPD